jgi:hypothetical protein
LLTRQSLDDPTQQEVVALDPWHVKSWLVDIDCAFYNPAPTTFPDEPNLVHVPRDDPKKSIATLRQFSPEAIALLTDHIEACPLVRPELTVKTLDDGQLNYGSIHYDATLDFVSKDFVRRFSLSTRKSKTKTQVRLANGKRVTSSTVCDITLFELAHPTFNGLFTFVYVIYALLICYSVYHGWTMSKHVYSLARRVFSP